MGFSRTWRRAGAGLSVAGVLAACGGQYGGAGGATPPIDTGSGDFKTVEEFFAARVQPRLELCRSCHIPGGVADVPDGSDFVLSGDDPDSDFANLRDAWERLGDELLQMPSGARPHTGGALWPPDSPAYRDFATLLSCFEDPAGCLEGISGEEPPPELPLLGSTRGGHVWESWCADRPDDESLPVDPRTLIQPGVNAGKAVFFNAYWEDCHANLPVAEQQPATCGEYKARRDRGRDFLLDGLPVSAMSAQDFNDTWQKWGLDARPDNFDALYTLRYGLNRAPFDNPYPLPGEDPNATDGGSGQLPLGLRQLKNATGSWSGRIGTAACFFCHGGHIGDPRAGEDALLTLENLGLGNSNYDVLMQAQDGSPFNGTALAPLVPPFDVNALFNIGIKQRGQNNAVGAFEFLITILDLDSLGINPNPLKNMMGERGVLDVAHPLAHTQDTPPWWNTGSRPRKFFDAGVSIDSTRIIMAAGPGEVETLFTADGKPYRDRIEQFDQDIAAFLLSLRSPEYPRGIDTALAQQGAVLFHAKDLWAAPGNAGRPRPLGGNGSCASCHGVYAPRYAHDPAYLETPALAGVAGHISPLAVIGTDRARSDMLTPTLRAGWPASYWGYPDGVEGWVAPADKDYFTESADDMSPLRPPGVCAWETGVIGYQAPPLHGVWATAPYFHNGSVPTLAQVLDSSQRLPIWRRKLQSDGPVTGFDQRLGEAYDFTALGWKHDAMACEEMPGTTALNCNPVDDQGPSLVELSQNFLNSTLSWAGLITIPDPAPDSLDKRLVYDTRILGNASGGHEFTDVLTDAERRALIEYLKTL